MASNLDWMPETHNEALVRDLKTTAAKKQSNTVAARSPMSAPPSVRDPFVGEEVWINNDETIEKLRAFVEGPLNAVLVGATMTGKSTFVNEVLGLDLGKAAVGNGLTSCTSMCRSYCKQLRDPDLTLNLIDTPGLIDSGGAPVDAEHQGTIERFLQHHHPDCVLLFLKFYDPADGRFGQACQFAASIAKVYKCNVLVVNTFCDPPEVSSFPAAWLEARLRERKEIGGTMSKRELWERWKSEKAGITLETLAKQGIDKRRIFQCHSCFSKRYELMKTIGKQDAIVHDDRRSEYELPDGTKMIPKILEEVSNGMGPRALRLIRECCVNEEARLGAETALGRTLQSVLQSVGVMGACLTGLIELVCNAVTWRNACQAELLARVEALHQRLGYDDDNAITKQALQNLLQSPMVAAMVGKTMTGKSTFAAKVMGSQGEQQEGEANKLPEVGGGMVSCTSKCRKFGAGDVEGVEFPLAIVDTPGLFDSSKPDEAVQRDITNFLRKEHPRIVLLFLKFSDPMDGAFEKTCRFAAQITRKHNCPLLVVHSLCDLSFDFPSSWVADKKRALEGLVGAVGLQKMLWGLWASEKVDNTMEHCRKSGMECSRIFQCHCSFPPRTNLDIIRDGDNDLRLPERQQRGSAELENTKGSIVSENTVLDGESRARSTTDGLQVESIGPPGSRKGDASVSMPPNEGGSNAVQRDAAPESNLEGQLKAETGPRGEGPRGLSNPNEEGVPRLNLSEQETIECIVRQLNRALIKSIRMALKQAEQDASRRRGLFSWIPFLR